MVVNVSTLEKLIYPIICAGSVLQLKKQIGNNIRAPSLMVNVMALVCDSAYMMGLICFNFIVVTTYGDHWRLENEHKNGKYFGKGSEY